MNLARYAQTVLLLGCVQASAAAQVTYEHTGSHSHEAHVHLLHFTHPLIAESVTPDTKVRLNYAHHRHTDETDWELEGEYAFGQAFSIETGAEYDQHAAAFTHVHVTPKVASFRWQERMLLAGYGVTLGVPVAGESAYDVEPFLNAGIKRGDWEFSAWSKYTHTFARGLEPAANAMGYNIVALLHSNARLQPVVELDGAAFSSSTEGNQTRVTPSLRFVPIMDSGLALAAGITVPVAGEKESSTVALSALYHF